MTIAKGTQLPDLPLQLARAEGATVSTLELFGNGRWVLFGVPGAFTPTCSTKHLPGFVQHFDAFRKAGFDVACLSVNDRFVMGAWAERENVPADLKMIADGNGSFARALGLELDATAYGMGLRAKRFAMLIDSGSVTELFVEAPGEFRTSSAEALLEFIGGEAMAGTSSCG